MNNKQNKTPLDYYERVVDNILRILWLVLLVMWISSEHSIKILQ